MFTRSQKCGLTTEKSWASLLHVTDSWAGTGVRPLSLMPRLLQGTALSYRLHSLKGHWCEESTLRGSLPGR